MNPPIQLTKKKIDEMIADGIKEALGMPADEAKKMFAELETLRKAQETIQRDKTGDIARTHMTSQYKKKNDLIIQRDPLKGAGLQLARIMRACALAKQNQVSAEDIALNVYKDKELADTIRDMNEARTKALGTNTSGGGGILVPTEQSAEIIEMLRASSIVLQSGVPTMPIPSGRMKLGRQNGTATAAWATESVANNASQLTLDEVGLDAKKCIALTPITNDLLRVESAEADQLVRNDLSAVLGLKVDLACIRGDGTGGSPRGVRNILASANAFGRTSASTPATLAEVTADVLKMWRLVSQANVPIRAPAWWCEDRSKFFLAGLRDGNNNLAFPEIMSNGTFFGRPIFSSNQIPTNLGGPTDETEFYFVETTQWIFGEKTSLMLEILPNAAYADSSGTTVLGASADQSLVRGIIEVDFAGRHNQGAAVLTGVDWAA
jgi:HK97 family phage major capsid protein